MNPKLQKVTDEIEKIRQKIAGYQSRLRELERQKTELENAGIIAMVRGVDIPPEDFADFVREFKERKSSENCAVPDMTDPNTEQKEDSAVEN